MTCCLFFAALSVSDNTVLLGAMIHMIKEKIMVERTMDSNLCLSYAYSFNLGASCSGWFIVVITFLRFNAVCNIFKKQIEMTRKMAIVLMLAIVVACVLLNLPVIYTAQLLGRSACPAYSRRGKFTDIWVWVVTVMFFLIPLALVTYFNIRIYRKIHKRGIGTLDSSQSNSVSRELDVLTSSDSGPSHNPDSPGISSNVTNKRTEHKVSKMIIVISAAFVCLSFPQYMRYAFFTNLPGSELKFLMFHITNKLFIINHAINFYLYCLSGAKFRKDFIKLLKKPYEWIKKLLD